MTHGIDDWGPIDPEYEPGSTHIPVSPEEDEMWAESETISVWDKKNKWLDALARLIEVARGRGRT